MSRVLSDAQRHRLAALLRQELRQAYAAAIAGGVPEGVVSADLQRRRATVRRLARGTAPATGDPENVDTDAAE